MSEAVSVGDLRRKALRVGAWSEVNDVRVFRASSELVRMPVETGHFRYDMGSGVTMQYLEQDASIIVTSDYSVSIRENAAEAADDGDADREPFYQLTFTLAALFIISVPNDAEPLGQDELDAFARSTGQFAIHPYAREFIADMTGRAGLPALHVGLLKIHLDASDEDNKQ